MGWLPILAALAFLAPGEPQVVVERLPRIPEKADVRLWRIAMQPPVFGTTRHSVFLRARTKAGEQHLRELGLLPERNVWQPAQLDTANLLSAVQALGVELRAAPAHRPMLEQSVPETGADRIHEGDDVQLPRTGDGVLIGLIDTGIDLTHPAFDGRVVAVWDQDATNGPSPVRFGYGRVCYHQEIEQKRCPINDASGHGTHVGGIAAGAAPRGVAPQAEIAVVRSANFTRVADAALFLVDLADERGMPVVINLSIGGHYGPHDGATPLERYLGRILGEGRVAVAAAGNDGGDRLHLGVDLGDEPVRVALENVPMGRAVDTIVDFWTAPRDRAALALELWIANASVASVPLHASDSEITFAELRFGGELALGATYGVELDEDHGRLHHTIMVDGSVADALPDGGEIVLSLSGSGTVNGWLSQSDYRFGQARFGSDRGPGWCGGDARSSVTVPGTAPGVVAVGAYTVRTEWRDEAKRKHQLSEAVIGNLAPFSARGPTTAPRLTGIKPDLVAPGSVIISARATTVPPGPMTVGSNLVVMQGTSMAAPHVSGVAALMLEADPKLTPARFRDQLARAARSPTSSNLAVAWGAGKLDALAAVQLAEREAPGCAGVSGAGWAALLCGVLVWRRRNLSARAHTRRLSSPFGSPGALR